jgi:glycosyltransferase involved in cell wall biosynthesis
MVVPPYYEIPPRAYGGIEATVAVLVDALIEVGHRVTLLSSGNHGTRAEHVRTYEVPQHERLAQGVPEVVHASAADRALRTLDVDVVHDHTLAGLLLARGRAVPTVATVHGPLTGEFLRLYADVGEDVGLVAISESQRGHGPGLNWAATVHNAVDPGAFIYREEKEDFVLFLGRMTPDKGIPHAIGAARAAGRRLVLGAKCSEPAELAYFESEVRPLLTSADVDYIGEVEGEQKRELLAAASALLFPICWEEPFGMVMIEAMASGTPVVALGRGAIPEVVADGVTGFVCADPAELPAALDKVATLRPQDCRLRVEEHFSPPVMANGYAQAYVEACRTKRLGSLSRRLSPPSVTALVPPAARSILPRLHQLAGGLPTSR